MNKSLRKISLVFLVVVLFSSLSLKTEAFSFSFNPVSYLSQTVNIIAGRISDLVYFLIMQKKYIFDGYSDPNSYSTSSVISADFGKIFSTSTVISAVNAIASTAKSFIPSQPIVVTTSTVPAVKKIMVVNPPALVSTSSVISNSAVKPISVAEPVYTDSDSSQILKFTNEERESASLNLLSGNPVLDTIAGFRADDMFANQYFDHRSPDGRSVVDLAQPAGYSYLSIGENIAKGYFGSNQAIIDAWMASPEHKANILNGKYTELGVAIKEGVFAGQNTTIAVQVFGTPLSACSKPNPASKTYIDSTSASIKEMQAQSLVMYDNLIAIKNIPGVDQSYYNQKIQEYNYFAKQINDAVSALTSVTNVYNAEVAEYNSCVKR